MRSRSLPLLALATLLGCASERPADPGAPVWHAEQVAEIGADSGTGSFVSVRSILFSPAGELIVVDDHEKEVKIFDSIGHFLRPLGRSGAGPGEYELPYSVAWLHDTLALLDPGNSRIGLFDAKGGWAGSLPSQHLTGGKDVRLYRTQASSFWSLGHQEGRGLFVRYTSAGPQDTLQRFWRPQAGVTQIACEVRGGIGFYSAPFAPSDLLIPTPTGTRAFARTDAYRIDFLGAAGDTLGTIMRAETGAPISDDEWENGLQEWNTLRKEAPTTKCDADGFDRPATKPILAALFYDPEGRLWVEVRTAQGPRYDVYDSDRKVVASVNGLPSSGEVDPAFLGDRIAIVLPSEEGFSRIGIYRTVTERHER